MKYADINYCDTVNGEGLRISVFVQGCSHHCKGCFNSQSWDFNSGKDFTKEDLEKIISTIQEHRDSYKGLSILGGEPFDNLHLSTYIALFFKQMFPEKDIWIWSGYTFEEIIKDEEKYRLLKLCDTLIDGEFIEELKDSSLKYKGSSNQRIVDVKKSIKNKSVIIKKGDK